MTRRALALVGVVVALGGAAAACGGESGAGGASAADIESGLLGRLEAKSLSVRWVTCVEGPIQGGAEVVYRCNVSFGDPHIESYCAVVRDGDLVTHLEDGALLCERERPPAGTPRG